MVFDIIGVIMKYSIVALLLFCVFHPIPVSAEDSVSINQEQLLPNIRKALSIPNEWSMRIVRAGPAPVPGLVQADLEVALGSANVRSQKIFLSENGRHYIIGNLFDTETDMDQVRFKSIDFSRSPSKGPEKAPVTIVEFSDLQCASCKNAHFALENDKIVESYKGKVRLVYKNFPLMRVHPWAFQGSVGALCAYRQKSQAFWSMINELYAKQAEVNVDNIREKLMASAQALKLNMPAFQTCFDTQATASDVSRDLAEGNALGISSTPTFMVNGRLVVGYPGAASLKRLIDEFLK